MIRWLNVLGCLCLALSLQGQSIPGPHAQHLANFGKKNPADYPNNSSLSTRKISRKCLPTLEIYGWHPAWSGDAYVQYDFPLVHTLSWFAYEVDPKTGSYLNLHGWEDAKIIQKAHDGGSQVDLTVFLAGKQSISTLLSHSSRIQVLRDSVVAILDRQDADGICLDFEGLQPSHGKVFLTLAGLLADTLHNHVPRRKLSITLASPSGLESFPLKQLLPLVDRFILKAYGTTEDETTDLNTVENWVDSWLSAGLPPSKLLLGMPLFGVKSNSTKPTQPKEIVLARDFKSQSMGYQASRLGMMPIYQDSVGQSLLVAEDKESLSARISMAQRKGLAGLAIWGLGYDAGMDEFWEVLKSKAADCSAERAESAEKETDFSSIPGSGLTSAERNQYHWIWMLGGGFVAALIMLAVRKMMK